MNLDSNQLKLYNLKIDNNIIKQAVCLVAGAGSGKTTTIISKIINMLENGCLPEHFFITTFTRSASIELKERLYNMIKNEVIATEIINKITIGTFHKIASLYLDKYNLSNKSVISSYDECLYLYAELIKSNDYIEEHKYIFIDEYQDINEIQETIIETIYFKTGKLLVTIGDDQQNIYSFRGSDIRFMLNFKEKYNGINIFLTSNYRCPETIVNMSNSLLKCNNNKIDKMFESNSNCFNKIVMLPIKCQDYNLDNFNYLISTIVLKKIFYLFSNKIITKKNKKTLAIISRFNYTLHYLETALTRKKIKSTYLGNEVNVYHDRIILSTIHGTKGLEFDNVIFIDFVPSKCINMTDLEEERRLFYVGITRAKEELSIIYQNINPSCFLRECWNTGKVAASIMKDNFINLPEDYTKFKIEYNFFKKTNFIQNNLEIICKNLSYNEINNLDLIIPFKSLLNSSEYIKKIKIHHSLKELINFKELIHDNNQLISSYEHLTDIFIYVYLMRELQILSKDKIFYEPIKLIIRDNYSLIKKINSTVEFTEKLKLTYNIDLFFNDNDSDILMKTSTLDDLKNYSNYIYNTIPKYLSWDSIIDPKLKNKFIKSINNYYNNNLKSNKIYDDIFNIAIILEICKTNRLSIQYLDIDKDILANILKPIIVTNKFINSIISLNFNNLYINNPLAFKNTYFLKYDLLINTNKKNNNYILFCIIYNESPSINDLIYSILKIILFQKININITKINLYVPLSGLIYQINISANYINYYKLFIEKIISLS